MLPSSTPHGGQHDTRYVTFELILHAAFVADEIWGFIHEPARSSIQQEPGIKGSTLSNTAVVESHATCARVIVRTTHITHIIHKHMQCQHTYVSGPHKLAVRRLFYRGCHTVESSRT